MSAYGDQIVRDRALTTALESVAALNDWLERQGYDDVTDELCRERRGRLAEAMASVRAIGQDASEQGGTQ